MENRAPGPGQRTSLARALSRCTLVDDLVSAVRGGESRALVVRGEAGIEMTALLDYLVESASDVTVLRAVGVESEMELAYAGLHLLEQRTAQDKSGRSSAPSEAGSGLRVDARVPGRWHIRSGSCSQHTSRARSFGTFPSVTGSGRRHDDVLDLGHVAPGGGGCLIR